MLTLYHWEPGPHSAEPLICLREKGLAFKGIYVDVLAGEQFTPNFLACNPAGQVPVLVHGDRVITETTLMLEYLEAAFPERPLSPQGAAGRYRMHVWTKLADEKLAPAVGTLGWRRMAPRFQPADLAFAEAAFDKLPLSRRAVWRKVLARSWNEADFEAADLAVSNAVSELEQALDADDWLAGDAYSLADIALFALVDSLLVLTPDLVNDAATPRLSSWLERMRARPAVRAVCGTARGERTFAPGPEPGRWG